MTRFRFRDDESSTPLTVASILLGAAAGFAAGMYVANRVGGLRGLSARLRRSVRRGAERDEGPDAYDEIEETDDVAGAEGADDGAPLLEERVLEAFNNDPILSERAIDIGAIGAGLIELAGWVNTDEEAEHAMTVAHGVPGVDTVLNRLLIDDEERQLNENAQRARDEDPSMTSTHWDGQRVGTGRRRQGTSAEMDRHADPKEPLEERWLSEREAVRNAADDIEGIAERRGREKKKETRPEA